MPIDTATPWHKDSFDRFLGECLPRLLAERVPLAGYRVEPEDVYTCRVTVVIAAGAGEITLSLRGLSPARRAGHLSRSAAGGGSSCHRPRPRSWMSPRSTASASSSTIILLGGLAMHRRTCPGMRRWHAPGCRSTAGHATFSRQSRTISARRSRSAQWLDQTNWLAIHTHLRRLVVRDPQRLFTPGAARPHLPVRGARRPEHGPHLHNCGWRDDS